MKKRFFLVLVLILLYNTSACAYISSPLDLKKDEPSATDICVGRVVSTTHGVPDDNAKADYETIFRVDRVLKGDAKPGSTISISYSQQTRYPRYCLDDYSLVLLMNEDGHYCFAKSSESSMPVSKTAYSTYKKSSSVPENLRWEMLNSLCSSDAGVYIAALNQTSLLSDPSMLPVLKKYAASKDMGARTSALRALVRLNDRDAIYEAINLLVQNGPLSDYNMFMLRSQFYHVQVDQEFIPVLGKELSSSNSDVRRFASHTLRDSGDPSAIPYLKAALYDDDQEVRYNGAIGLAQHILWKIESHVICWESYLLIIQASN